MTKSDWDVEAASATYNVDGWGDGYFSVNPAGNVAARPLKEAGGAIDLLEVVNEARARGLGFPLVIRFQDLLRHRVETVNRAFQAAMDEFGYRNHYRGVFPIKVNQLREVIEEIVDAGAQFHFGLEAGSKPELIAALAMALSVIAGCNEQPPAAAPDPCSLPPALRALPPMTDDVIPSSDQERLGRLARARRREGGK